MSLNLENKREKEKQVVEKMILIYCRRKHSTKLGLCKECGELRTYAFRRSDRCPFMATKVFCSNCRIHCYNPHMREKIRKVMGFSGIRLLLYHPFIAIRHMFLFIKGKSK